VYTNTDTANKVEPGRHHSRWLMSICLSR